MCENKIIVDCKPEERGIQAALSIDDIIFNINIREIF
jgi:hypothetical protein